MTTFRFKLVGHYNTIYAVFPRCANTLGVKNLNFFFFFFFNVQQMLYIIHIIPYIRTADIIIISLSPFTLLFTFSPYITWYIWSRQTRVPIVNRYCFLLPSKRIGGYFILYMYIYFFRRFFFFREQRTSYTLTHHTYIGPRRRTCAPVYLHHHDVWYICIIL